MAAVTYKDAGVDLDVYEQSMQRLPALLGRTHSPRVMPLTGGFAGLFQLQGDGRRYEDPVLVSGTDGVGTKLKVAIRAGRFDTVGIDLVAMCVNDCLCLGAEPLFFLDYLALGKDDPDLVEQLVKGVSEGCVQAGAALIGGETAIMPDLYAAGDFDMAGFCVGVVEKSQLIDGSQIQAGDVLLGVPSSGLHSNGFSLVRKIVFDHAGLGIDDPIAELGGSVADVLLTPTRIYANVVRAFMTDPTIRSAVRGIAHITGGGLAENVSRIVPAGCRAVFDETSWDVPLVFPWLQRLGGVADDEMSRVFNQGIGLVLIVAREAAESIASKLAGEAENVRQIGQIVRS
ncbi:MAG: phosphoribosylformylglycinamidine cyclo-ligase [Planctomycetaceae bacterium]|nr:phosphoribosylformylglycinamidine cyclo-ligase [Planctomycetaceae bacterium]